MENNRSYLPGPDDEPLMLAEIVEIIGMIRKGGLIELSTHEHRRSLDGGVMSAAKRRLMMISAAATAGSLAYRRGDDDERECRGFRANRQIYAALDELRDALNRRYSVFPFALHDLKPTVKSLTDVTDAIAILIIALNGCTSTDEIDLNAAAYLSPLRSGPADAVAAQEWALDYIEKNDR